jgi:hypothetical protein
MALARHLLGRMGLGSTAEANGRRSFDRADPATGRFTVQGAKEGAQA